MFEASTAQTETSVNLHGLKERNTVKVDWNNDETMIRRLSAGSHRDWRMSPLSDWWWWWRESPAGRFQLRLALAAALLRVPRTPLKLVLVRTITGRHCKESGRGDILKAMWAFTWRAVNTHVSSYICSALKPDPEPRGRFEVGARGPLALLNDPCRRAAVTFPLNELPSCGLIN